MVSYSRCNLHCWSASNSTSLQYVYHHPQLSYEFYLEDIWFTTRNLYANSRIMKSSLDFRDRQFSQSHGYCYPVLMLCPFAYPTNGRDKWADWNREINAETLNGEEEEVEWDLKRNRVSPGWTGIATNRDPFILQLDWLSFVSFWSRSFAEFASIQLVQSRPPDQWIIWLG